MAWRGGRSLLAAHLELAAGLRQRTLRAEESLVHRTFAEAKALTLCDAPPEPALEKAQLKACARAVAALGDARASRVEDLATTAGLREVPRELLYQPLRWREGVVRPDRSALDADALRMWYRSSPDRGAALQGGFVREEPGARKAYDTARSAAAGALEAVITGAYGAVENAVSSAAAGAQRHAARASDAARNRVADAADRASAAAVDRAARALPSAYADGIRRKRDEVIAPELARLRAPRDAGTAVAAARAEDDGLPPGLVDVLVLERKSASDFAVEWHAEVPARYVGALSPSGAFSIRLHTGDRALAWLVLAATSALPIYRSAHFAAEWSASHVELAQGALLACAATLAWGAWRARGIDEDRLRLDLLTVLRVHRLANGPEALDKLSRLAARALARDAAAAAAGTAVAGDRGARAAALLRDAGLAPAGDAAAVERDLATWVRNQLARGKVRGLDTDAPWFPQDDDRPDAAARLP